MTRIINLRNNAATLCNTHLKKKKRAWYRCNTTLKPPDPKHQQMQIQSAKKEKKRNSSTHIPNPQPPLLNRKQNQLLDTPQTALLPQRHRTKQLAHPLQHPVQLDRLLLHAQRGTGDTRVVAQIDVVHDVVGGEVFGFVAVEVREEFVEEEVRPDEVGFWVELAPDICVFVVRAARACAWVLRCLGDFAEADVSVFSGRAAGRSGW